MRFDIDPSTWTLGDLEDFETYVGVTAASVFSDGVELSKLPAKALTALVWIVRRADNPEFTIEDARRVGIVELVGAEEDADL